MIAWIALAFMFWLFITERLEVYRGLTQGGQSR